MRHTKENNKGQALIIVLLLGIVVLILVMALTSNVTQNAQQNNENYNGQLSFTAAQSEAQNGINSINTTNQSNGNGDIPQPVTTTSPRQESCNNVIPSASATNKNCQYTTTDNTLNQSTSINVAYGVMLPINLLSPSQGDFSGTLYVNISGSSGDQLQAIYMTDSGGSNETMTTCVQGISSAQSSYTIPLTNSSVVYLELLGNNGGDITYSSSPLGGPPGRQISGCSSSS